MKFVRLTCWLFSGLMLAASGAYAQNSITALTVGDIANGMTIVKVELAQPLANLPAGFTTDTPPRIVLDFPDTANGLGKSIQDFTEGGLRSANIVQAGGRTRLVINLDRMLVYNTKIDGNSLSISLQSNAVDTKASSNTLRLAEANQGVQKLPAKAGQEVPKPVAAEAQAKSPAALLPQSGPVAQGAEPEVTPGKAKKAITKKAKPAVKKAVKPDARALQAQREAEARIKAEQEARQRAEAEAKKQAALEAREKPIKDAEEMMKNGKPADAYALLEPLEFERSGEVRFDYLIGIAALDSGKPDKATLAFERVLAVDPNFAGARLDMARAYYQLGDLQRAETEFNEVMKQNPPEAARVTIQKYLDAIMAYEQAKQTRITGYVEGVVGHDSNIANSSTQTFTFAPTSPWSGLFPGNQLPPGAKLTGVYEGINAGGEISHSLNANWGVFAGADLRQHGNMTQTVYDSLSVDGRIGVMHVGAQDTCKLSLTGGQSYTANTMRRDSLGLSAEWQHTFSPANQVSAFAQYGESRAYGFPPTSPTTDARIEGDTDQVVVGAGWVHIMGDGKQALFGSIYAGKELDVAPAISPGLPNGGRTDGKKRFEGVRVGGQMAITEQWDGIISLGWQSANYGNLNNLIMDSRSEEIYDLTVGGGWHIDKLWSLKPQIAFSRKNSNIALYSFDRTDVSLTIRRDFK